MGGYLHALLLQEDVAFNNGGSSPQFILAKSTHGFVGGAGQVELGNGTQITVGAAGAASALPATPTGFLIINVAGANKVIPFYDQA